MDKHIGLYSTMESHFAKQQGELISTTVRMNLVDITLREGDQSQKRPYCLTPFIKYSRTGKINWDKEEKNHRSGSLMLGGQ